LGIPARIRDYTGRCSLVDGIPFHLPVQCVNSPALFAVFSIDAGAARALLPGDEVYPLRLWKRGLLVVSVIDYLDTTIGKYIEFSIAIACTHGRRQAPPLLPAIFQGWYGTGQYVVDLPVSSEISVKGGKGIWGMPKHQASLDYRIDERTVSSQYDVAPGQLGMRIEIARPRSAWLPVSATAANYCEFRGLLMKSYIDFKGKVGFTLLKKGAARMLIGDHPAMAWLKPLDIDPEAIVTAFIPAANGVLDDHFESWFLTFPAMPPAPFPGLETVVDLGLSQAWLAPPTADGRDAGGAAAASGSP
jgi:Acetoacetate decarboxylase (ADC)